MTTNILGFVLIFLCVIPLLSIALFGWWCYTAPRGWEDSRGFHEGDMPEGTTYYD